MRHKTRAAEYGRASSSHHAGFIVRRRFFLAASLLSVLGGCKVPFVGGGDKKSECDRMAAEAIQTKDSGHARDLAAGASGCYAKLSQ